MTILNIKMKKLVNKGQRQNREPPKNDISTVTKINVQLLNYLVDAG